MKRRPAEEQQTSLRDELKHALVEARAPSPLRFETSQTMPTTRGLLNVGDLFDGLRREIRRSGGRREDAKIGANLRKRAGELQRGKYMVDADEAVAFIRTLPVSASLAKELQFKFQVDRSTVYRLLKRIEKRGYRLPQRIKKKG